MNMPRLRLLYCALSLVACALVTSPARAAWLGGIDFSHPTPSHLPHGERVYVDIDYSHADAGGTRIFVIPLSGGSPAPAYAVSGSGLLPAGTGTTSRYFTITSGDVTVDAVRITMTNADQSVTYFSFEVRVGYIYGASGIYNIQFSHGDPSILANGENLTVTFDYGTTAASDVIIFARPWHNNSVVYGYGASGGSVGTASGSGSQHFQFPTVDADVNQVHFTMYNSDQSVLLLAFDAAVDYRWRDVGLGNITLLKPAPGSVQIADPVGVSFDWVNPTGGDVLVWTMPRLGNVSAPNVAPHGSSYLPPGSGTAVRYFSAGTVPAEVDAFRLLCTNADQSVEYTNIPYQVHYVFDHYSVDNISMVPERPAILDVGTTLQVTFDYHNDQPEDVYVWALPWLDGAWPFLDFSYSPSAPLSTGSGTIVRGMTGLENGVAIDHVLFRFGSDSSTVLFDYLTPTTAFWAGAAATSPVPGAGLAAPVVLGQNYPNPFNPLTTIPVELDATRHVKLSVYDLRGRRVAVLVDGMMGGGRHEIPFDGTRLASGQYIYKLEGTGGTGRTMTLVK